MPYLLVRHKVAEYGKWKSVFDEHTGARKAAGSKGGQLFRAASDPNHLVILLEVEGLDKARQFTESEDLSQTMQRAGVVDKPEIYFLEEIERPSA